MFQTLKITQNKLYLPERCRAALNTTARGHVCALVGESTIILASQDRDPRDLINDLELQLQYLTSLRK
jgi:hypothetical protein